MWLRALAGAYAGEVRDFRTDVGLKALRSGTAERVDEAQILTPPLVAEIAPIAVPIPDPIVVALAPVVIVGGKKRKHR